MWGTLENKANQGNLERESEKQKEGRKRRALKTFEQDEDGSQQRNRGAMSAASDVLH